jgi:hypothetical protein
MSDDSSQIEAQEQVIPGVSSGALLDAMEDPSMFEAIARADLYAQLALMRRHAAHPELSFGQRVDYAKFLAKMGKVEAPEKSATDHLAGVPPIQIILPNSGGSVQIGTALPSDEEKDITPKQSSAVLP